ncbi:putative ATP-dependent DNA helicase HFM1 [Tetrabaena socialis]|uniref:DNA 3'-5' helicase n=1 Tax=Tetrabaena socialis TaxID=47790 RepID=A0A2J8A7B2_9CHLO|nr:putative ATP-dependent DNA helicase HFM1 [Tetrabaena socialis]|eukprot:PNH08408.1 putative ATP-dependent DNA helicase HFM1 [Tetrabaena socialis]
MCFYSTTHTYCGADGGGGGAEEGSGGGYREYDRSVCLQMVGRAGRPQFDTEGVAVIMTQKETYDRYTNLLSGSEPVESCLHECFPEHLNAEVVLGTVRDMASATAWLRTTFLYIRIRQAPRTYGMERPPAGAAASGAAYDEWLVGRLVGGAVARLAEVGLVGRERCSSS